MTGTLKLESSDIEETRPLTYEFTSEKPINQDPVRQSTIVYIWSWLYFIVLHFLVLILVIILWNTGANRVSSKASEGVSWSPVRHLVEYELSEEHAVDHGRYSAYSGAPTPDQTRAWENLVGPIFFNATREELEQAGESVDDAVMVKGGGYLATVSVYHDLHCLRQLRFYIFRETYYPHMTEEDEIYTRGHLDHCLEALRINIMCHANTGLNSFSWGDPNVRKPVTRTSSKSMCVKWKSIEDWALSRTVGMDPVLLRPASNINFTNPK